MRIWQRSGNSFTYSNLCDKILICVAEMLYLASNLQRKDNKMGINRYVLFVDTPLGSLEAETVQAKVLQGIKITLRDDGKEEPEIRVQYNPEKKAVEVLLFEAAGQEPIMLHTIKSE